MNAWDCCQCADSVAVGEERRIAAAAPPAPAGAGTTGGCWRAGVRGLELLECASGGRPALSRHC